MSRRAMFVFLLLSTTATEVLAQSAPHAESLLTSSLAPVKERCSCECVHDTHGALKVEQKRFSETTFHYDDITDDDECSAKNGRRCNGYQNSNEDRPAKLTGTLKSCEITTELDPLYPELEADAEPVVSADAITQDVTSLVEAADALEAATEEDSIELEAAATEVFNLYATSTSLAIAPVVERCICYCVNPAYGGLEVSSLGSDSEFEYRDISTDSACSAKNNRRCAGWFREGNDIENLNGVLTDCAMTAVAETKVQSEKGDQ